MFPRLFASALLAFGIVAAALPASAEPALWKVQGPHATVYLFGTVHILKTETQWRSAKIEQAFASSGTLWEEVGDSLDPVALQPLVLQYGFDREHPLSAQLDDATKAKLVAFETKYGVPAAGVEMMRPWLAAMVFSVLPSKKTGYDGKSGVDMTLRTLAKDQSKPLMGFETMEQQIRFFADMPQADQVAYLSATLRSVDTRPGYLDDLVDAWAAGDADKLETLLRFDEPSRGTALYQTLIAHRNQAFAAKIEELLKGDGTSFVAVGAAHLLGPDSVQSFLAKDGVSAVRQ